jgi:UPF0716 protein FxsA
VVLSAASGGAKRTIGSRRRFSPIGFGFVVGLLAEILAFIGVGHLIGYGWAFLLLIGVSMIGGVLFVRQTPRAWRDLRTVVESGERPGPQLVRHLAGLIGAILIAVPGFITAVIGASLFLPPIRMLAGRAVTGYATRRMSSSVAGDLFGPRRVRVKVGKVSPADSEPARTASTTVTSDEPIEGEIV